VANQPETPTYDPGVYQWEVTDPVQGGVSGIANLPLLNLANRTDYLKQRLDALINGTLIPPTVAPLNGPAFTGSSTAPNVAPGDDSTLIANTDFVQTAKHGIVFVACGGNANVVLTQPQWGVGILVFTGVLTGNISVLFPSRAGCWIVQNATTGPFTLTCKTVTGTGVTVLQSAPFNAVWCDGVNINPQISPYVLNLTNPMVVAALGFTPVEQGGGPNQGSNKVRIGWGTNGRVRVQVDVTDLGNFALERDANSWSALQTFGAGLVSSIGARSSVSPFQVPILNDFQAGSNARGWWIQLPASGLTPSNIVMIQGGSIVAPGDNSGAFYPLPQPYPNLFVTIVISYGGAVPPTQGSIGAQPSGPANFLAVNSSTQGQSNGCNWLAFGW
jgi:hypothetical protein